MDRRREIVRGAVKATSGSSVRDVGAEETTGGTGARAQDDLVGNKAGGVSIVGGHSSNDDILATAEGG